ncbi:MAG TPA: MltA domain-containing protein [Xanthobacteraceae bacterium]
MLRPVLLSFLLLTCIDAAAETRGFSLADAQLEPLSWQQLDGWAADDHAAALRIFVRSCRAAAGRKSRSPTDVRTLDAALLRVCRGAAAASPPRARAFFERHFRPMHIARLGESQGFLTGYYEPVVEGSRTRTAEFNVPVYGRPLDLVSMAPAEDSNFSNKGAVYRRDGTGALVPYFDRAAIEDGALEGRGLEICWLKDPIDAFFMQIQGSARVRLQDGSVLRLNYAAHNGYPYTPVGRILIDQGQVPREEMSMDRIRQWMQGNPAGTKELRRQNRSFVFFHEAKLKADEEAIGGQGIPLAAGRSIAVDRKLHAYGTPFWIEAELPLNATQSTDRFRRLLIAQDTGSAIVGPARADIYFGAGLEAGTVSGRIRHPGRFIMLIPNTIRLGITVKRVPSPRPRP